MKYNTISFENCCCYTRAASGTVATKIVTKQILVEAEALWRKKLEAEANAFDFLRSLKRKHFS